MILKASTRSGGKQLGEHLLKTEENEHVEVHEVTGFVSDNIMGAINEAYALSRGTKCGKYLFSMSLSPPSQESVRVEVFEKAIDNVEERLGLKGQPRIIVFHEKEGRRHCHAVWSRIDADSMTAKNLPFFKRKLNDLAKQIYLENGWALPKGFADPKLRDPRNFTLDDWQKAKRAGNDPRELKSTVQEAWKSSDSARAFQNALEDRGLFLARGDRRGFVAVTIDGEVFAISRLVDAKEKDIGVRLGNPSAQRSVDETKQFIAAQIAPRLSHYISESKRMAQNALRPLIEQKSKLGLDHQTERQKLDQGQAERWKSEQTARASRMRKGWAGAWDFLTGKNSKIRKQNEIETHFALGRDRNQRHELLQTQHEGRQTLQQKIMETRTHYVVQLLGLYRDAAKFRCMREGREQAPARVRDKGLDLG
jgi:Relaxase/Mobilisation nuclease domain